MAEDSNWGEDTLKQKITKEYNKVKVMSFKEKRSYYMTYYFVPTVIAVIIIVVAAIIVHQVFFDKSEIISAGAYLNVEITDEGIDYINTGFTEYIKQNKKDTREKAHANLGTDVTIRFDENNEPINSDYQSVMSFNTLVMSGAVDYVFVGENALKYMEIQSYHKDLSEIADDVFLEENKDLIVYFDEPETGKKIPAAIDISNTEFAKKMIVSPDKVYLLFIDGSNNEQNDKMLLDYIKM